MHKYIIIGLIIILLGIFSLNMHALEIYAHRGFAAFWPENTLLSYEKSLELGVDSLDIDIALTKDNIVVGSHDPFLNKDITLDNNGNWLSNNKIQINDLTFAELQTYKVGKVRPNSKYAKDFPLRNNLDNITAPSLEQVIDLIKTKGNTKHKLQIEIKTNPKKHNQAYIEKFVRAIISTLEKNSFVEKAELQSFDWRTLLYAKQLNSRIKTSFITQQSLSFDSFNTALLNGKVSWTAGHKIGDHDNSIIKLLSFLGADNWCPYYKNVTKELVEQAHKTNIRVIPWTADTKEDMLKLIDDGVDGIITNRADIMREVMSSKGMPLPA